MQQLSTLLATGLLIMTTGLQAGTPVHFEQAMKNNPKIEINDAAAADTSSTQMPASSIEDVIVIADNGTPRLDAKFGSGITVTTANESFSLQLRGRFQGLMQVAHAYNSDETAMFGAQIRRARFKMSGHVGRPLNSDEDEVSSRHRMEYAVQLGYSNRDIVGIAEGSGVLLDAYLTYKPCNGLAIQVGQAKLPGNRQFLTSSQKQNFVDRGVSSVFRLDRDFGIQFKGSFGSDFVFAPTFSIATGEGRNQVGLTTSGLDFTFRTDFMPFGDFKGAFEMGDVRREPEPKLAFGAAYDANHNARYARGQRGGDEVMPGDRTTIHTVFADAIFKYKGLSVFAEYAHRTVGDDYRSSYTTGNALTTSVGYVFEKMYEVAFRYGRTSPLDNISLDKEMRTGANEYTIAASKYFMGHNLKVQTDYTIVHLVNGDLDAGLWRLQFEVAF